jgi:glycerol transport system ATP-binding protein
MGITAEHITKKIHGVSILKDVSLTVEDGSFAVLLGATGAGKTALLRILAGIDFPDEGRVLYDGVDVTRTPVRKRGIAFVYQQFVNYPSLTVYENIASPLRVARPKIPKSDIDRRVRETAELLGLSEILQHRPEEVSGGQRQRTAIARALAKDTQYIFLDEPLANLDYKLREELRGELKRIFRDRGGAVMYATPEPVDALSMASHVGFMRNGDLVQFGVARDVYENPASDTVGAYFSYPAMNILDCQVERRDDQTWIAATEDLAFPAPKQYAEIPEGQYRLGLRAHTLHTRPSPGNAIRFSGEVELAEVVGSDTEIHLQHEDIELILLSPELHRRTPGETMDVFLDPSQCYLFDDDTGERIAT